MCCDSIYIHSLESLWIVERLMKTSKLFVAFPARINTNWIGPTHNRLKCMDTLFQGFLGKLTWSVLFGEVNRHTPIFPPLAILYKPLRNEWKLYLLALGDKNFVQRKSRVPNLKQPLMHRFGVALWNTRNQFEMSRRKKIKGKTLDFKCIVIGFYKRM